MVETLDRQVRWCHQHPRARSVEVHPFADVPSGLAELDERRAVGKHVVRVAG